MDPRIYAFLSFVAICLAVAAVGLLVQEWLERRRRLAQRLPREEPLLPSLVVQEESQPATTFWGRINRWFRQVETENGMQPAEAVFLWELVVGLLIGGGLYLWSENIVLATAGFLLGMTGVTIFFAVQMRRRRRLMQEQLPEVMELMARAVRAGETLDQALMLVGETAEEPLKSEFSRCARQLSMGLSVESAVRALTRRVPLPEARILATTIAVQRRAGGSLPVTLERLSRVIRDRLSYQRQYRAATAAGRFSMYLILLAGPAVMAYMWYFQRDYMDDFLTTPQGQLLTAIAVVLQVIGVLWVLALLRSDY